MSIKSFEFGSDGNISAKGIDGRLAWPAMIVKTLVIIVTTATSAIADNPAIGINNFSDLIRALGKIAAKDRRSLNVWPRLFIQLKYSGFGRYLIRSASF